MSEDEFKALDILTPDKAKADAVKNLGEGAGLKFSSVRVLSNLGSIKEVRQYGARFLVSAQLPFYFGYLKLDAVRELELRASMKRKGLRARDDVVAVVKEHIVPGAQGVASKLKSFVT